MNKLNQSSNEVKIMKRVAMSPVEKTGTGVEKSGTGMRFSRSAILSLIVMLLWGSAAIAVNGGGTGTSSADTDNSLPTVAISEDLAIISFKDGYRLINGYGYFENDYARVSLYSLEYVHVMDTESDSANILVNGGGTGTSSETAPVNGGGTGGPTEDGLTSSQQLKAWGIAEVVLSERGIADIIVYRLDDEGVFEEVGVYSGVEVH